MNLQIERRYVDALMASFPDLVESFTEQLRFGDKVEVSFSQLSNEQLDFLQDLYGKAGPEMQVGAFWKMIGSFGISAPVSLAWSM